MANVQVGSSFAVKLGGIHLEKLWTFGPITFYKFKANYFGQQIIAALTAMLVIRIVTSLTDIPVGSVQLFRGLIQTVNVIAATITAYAMNVDPGEDDVSVIELWLMGSPLKIDMEICLHGGRVIQRDVSRLFGLPRRRPTVMTV